MLSNHLQNGIETAKLVWSRIPNSEDGEPDPAGHAKRNDDGNVESLDYEVIENSAYWDEQVEFPKTKKKFSFFVYFRGFDSGV